MSDDGKDESGGKCVGGHIAVAIAAIGAFIARGADDCGRVALKTGSSVGDDAFRGASRVGAVADDGMRTGKFGAGAVAEDGLRGAHAESTLVEEAAQVGAKAESHAGDLAELGVDVSLEAVQNVSSENDDGDDAPGVVGNAPAPQGTETAPKIGMITLLQNRTRVSQPAFLPVMPASSKAFQAVLGRPETPAEKSAYAALESIPKTTESLNPFIWLKGRIAHNPIGIVALTTDKAGSKKPIPLLLPNGDTTDDTAIHRACIDLAAHCILLVCSADGEQAKVPCSKAATATWQSLTVRADDTPMQTLLAHLMDARAKRIALQNLTISRLDISTSAPRIVRSRLTRKN